MSPWGGPHYHFTFCHDGIVRSLHLFFIEMHSLAHFNMCVAFDGESEIQFLMFCLLVIFITVFSKYRRNFVIYGMKYGYMRKNVFEGL